MPAPSPGHNLADAHSPALISDPLKNSNSSNCCPLSMVAVLEQKVATSPGLLLLGA